MLMCIDKKTFKNNMFMCDSQETEAEMAGSPLHRAGNDNEDTDLKKLSILNPS